MNPLSIIKSEVAEKSSDLRQVGKVLQAHGIKGEVYIIIFANDLSWVDRVESFWLGPEAKFASSGSASYLEKEIAASRVFKHGLIVHFKDIETRNQSELLKGQFIFVPNILFVDEPNEDDFYLAAIENFTVLDGREFVGIIEGFLHNNAQDLLNVRAKDGRTVIIPLVDAFLAKIDFEEKKVYMNLPEGLLTLDNLQE